MPLLVTSVEPLDGYRLRLTFSDGVVTEADFSDDLRGPLAEPLRDPAYFGQARIDEEARTIVWPNGLDPDPYVLHGDHPPGEPSGLRVRRIDAHPDPVGWDVLDDLLARPSKLTEEDAMRIAREEVRQARAARPPAPLSRDPLRQSS